MKIKKKPQTDRLYNAKSTGKTLSGYFRKTGSWSGTEFYKDEIEIVVG